MFRRMAADHAENAVFTPAVEDDAGRAGIDTGEHRLIAIEISVHVVTFAACKGNTGGQGGAVCASFGST